MTYLSVINVISIQYYAESWST